MVVLPSANNDFSLGDLRTFGHLEAQAVKQLQKKGLATGFVEDCSGSGVASMSTHLEQSAASAGSTLKGKRSGLDIVKHDCIVIRPQRCPHTHLRNEFAAVNIKFRDLSLRLFVAGEVEIISTTDEVVERKGRENLLRRIMYHAGKYDWAYILDFYAAVIKSIESGEKEWGDSFQEIEHMVLGMRVPLGSEVSSEKNVSKRAEFSSSPAQKSILFCAPFQKGECSHTEHAHESKLWGRQVVVRHICAKCWQTEKVLSAHSQNSSECPLKMKTQ